MSICSYKNENYECDKTVRNGADYCLFHDKTLLEDDNYEKNKDTVAREFKLHLKNHRSDKPLKLIGFCLPEYSFESELFSQPVYFNNAIFYGDANFHRALFSRKAHFFGTEFRKGAKFERAKFLGKAYFNGTVFHDVSFKKAEFSNSVYFSYDNGKDLRDPKYATTFHSNTSFEEAIFYEDANFHTTTFLDNVTFFRATFNSTTYFFRIKFCELTNFNECTFLSKADFRTTYFYGALFRYVRFASEVYFMDVVFKEKTLFNYSIFEKPNEAVFGLRDRDVNYRERIDSNPRKSKEEWIKTNIRVGEFQLGEFDMSKVSFVNCDVSRLRLSDKIKWGGADGFTIYDEIWFIEEERFNKRERNRPQEIPIREAKNVNVNIYKEYDSPSLDGVISVYRSLRENYEFRLRYDDAGKFFKKEMELKRIYRKAHPPSKFKLGLIKILKQLKLMGNRDNVLRAEYHHNWWPRRHFSLTGLYYHLSRYGESISRPIIIGIIIVGLSTLFWAIQNIPIGEPSITLITNNKLDIAKTSTDNFINYTQILNNTHTLKAFERSISDFLPLLSMPSDTKIGILDFIVKIVGGGLTFVLLGVALRRKFERKYTR